VLNFVKRNLWVCDLKHKSLAYTSLVRPHLEYAAVAWDPYLKKHTDLLNKVQNRAARFCTNDYSRTSSVSQQVKQLGWPSLETRRRISRLIELHKIIYGNSPISNSFLQTPTRSTRQNSSGVSFTTISSRIDIFKFSFHPRTVVDWNSLPVDLRSIESVEAFRSGLCRLFNTSQ